MPPLILRSRSSPRASQSHVHAAPSSPADVERADAVAEALGKRPALRAASHGGAPSRSTVLRYALSRGLDVIEAELADNSK